jgi:hypothetical protein
VLRVFHDHTFRVNRGKGKVRVLEKAAHSFVDVQAVRVLKDGIRSVTKDLLKARKESQRQNLALVLGWIFRKRSFVVSGDLDVLLRMERKKARHKLLVQTDL